MTKQISNPEPGIYFRVSKKISHRKLITIIISRWYWLLLSLILGLTSSFFYLKYITPLYSTTASLKFEEKKSEISELLNVRNLYDRTNKSESEKLIISSKQVLSKAISALNYPIGYYSKSSFQTEDLYPLVPLNIKIIKQHYNKLNKDDVEFEVISSSQYRLNYTFNNKSRTEIYNYNQIVSLPFIQFRIQQPDRPLNTKITYFIKFNNETDLLKRISSSLKINETQNVNLLSLNFTDSNPRFATDILNAILNEYLKFDKSIKAASAIQTAAFINSLLHTITISLDDSGRAMQKFKESNNLLTTTADLANYTDRLTDLEKEKQNTEAEAILISSLERNLSGISQLSYHLKSTDPLLFNLLSKYNELIIRRKTLSHTYTLNSPEMLQLNEQLSDYKIAISNNINAHKKQNNNNTMFLKQLIDSNIKSFRNLPEKERKLTNLQSKLDVNKKVYSYLAEKQLEAQIATASVTPGAIIIDKAEYPEKPISPVPKNIYITFTLTSLALSVIFIFVVRLLNPYIYNADGIEQFTSTPIIGVIKKHTYNANTHDRQIAIIANSRSLFSESIRAIRSNLSFIATEQNSKVICITSEIAGEGKSFIALNLATALTLIDKKVLLIAADLRKSTLHQQFKISNQNGLSKYLSNQTTLDLILKSTYVENLDFISSGPTPPNPSELLHGKKMEVLISSLKEKYDYILVDTAPIGLVADGKPFIKIADINLFVLRTGVSKHHFATTPEKLSREFNLSNMKIILNAFEHNQLYNNCYYAQNNIEYQKQYYFSEQTNQSGFKNYLDL